MATEAQIAANRRNAQKSTGPRTPEGKARVARNSLKHGLRAEKYRFFGESLKPPEHYIECVREHFRPTTELEEALALEIAALQWQTLKVARVERDTILE